MTLKIAIHTLSFPIMSVLVHWLRYFDRSTKLVKFGVKLKMMTRQKSKKVVMISVCRQLLQKLQNFLPTKDALNAVTILQTFFMQKMQKTDIEYSNLVFYKS